MSRLQVDLENELFLFLGASEYQNGWDIWVSVGTPVSTIADGKVIAVGPARGYGN